MLPSRRAQTVHAVVKCWPESTSWFYQEALDNAVAKKALDEAKWPMPGWISAALSKLG